MSFQNQCLKLRLKTFMNTSSDLFIHCAESPAVFILKHRHAILCVCCIIQGCATGPHSNVKPPEPEKPKQEANIPDVQVLSFYNYTFYIAL